MTKHKEKSCYRGVGASAITEDSWPLDTSWVRWLLREAKMRGILLAGVMTDDDGSWLTCSPGELLDRMQESHSTAWVTQRPGACGLVTTVTFTDESGLYGAWFADREPHEAEDHLWRNVLLEVLVLDWRNNIDSLYDKLHVDNMKQQAAK